LINRRVNRGLTRGNRDGKARKKKKKSASFLFKVSCSQRRFDGAVAATRSIHIHRFNSSLYIYLLLCAYKKQYMSIHCIHTIRCIYIDSIINISSIICLQITIHAYTLYSYYPIHIHRFDYIFIFYYVPTRTIHEYTLYSYYPMHIHRFDYIYIYARRKGQPTQRATNYTARSNIEARPNLSSRQRQH